MTKRIKLVVSYDGTDYHGWAEQPGLRTIQGTLRSIIENMTATPTDVVGASRTDSGAHAKGQVCHFDTTFPADSFKWMRIINDRAEEDLSIISSKAVQSSFHSRFCAIHRHYRYRIHLGSRDPLSSRYVYSLESRKRLEVEAMQTGAQYLVGTHDFLALSEKSEESDRNNIRTIYTAQVRQVSQEVWIDIIGSAFIKGMMRRISGALLEIGLNRRSSENIQKLLDLKVRESIQWPQVLPACGLTLMNIKYGRHPKDFRKNVNLDAI